MVQICVTNGVSMCSMAGSAHSQLIYERPENNRKQGSEACTEAGGETQDGL